jgi:hypothetical protein
MFGRGSMVAPSFDDGTLKVFSLPKRYGHVIFAVIQSFLTSAIAAAIAHSTDDAAVFLDNWIRSWLLSWLTVLPVVLLVAPVIRRIVNYVSRDRTKDTPNCHRKPRRTEQS